MKKVDFDLQRFAEGQPPAAERIPPNVRAAKFDQLTRQHIQASPSFTLAEGETKTFELPKTRLLSKIQLLVEAVVNVVHASSTAGTAHAFSPWLLLDHVKVDLNNGFTPYRLNSKALAIYNRMSKPNSFILDPATSGRGRVVQNFASAASGDGGVDNTIRMLVDLPIAINDRDPIGLILLQHPQVLGTVEVKAIDDIATIITDTTGFTVTLESMTVTPVVHTFSIPADNRFLPDVTLLKMVQSYEYTIGSTGDNIIPLPCGNTYRKFAFYLEDGSGNPVLDSELSGNFELSFNQAKSPYQIPVKVLSAMNQEQYGDTLPDGVWVFDFTYQGFANYGGARDYLDTENLTELWLHFSAAETGKATIITERMARMKV